MIRVTLYTKPGCSLCDEARDVIEHAREHVPFELQLRNILEDLGDFERYKHDIPVILLNEREIARHRIDLSQLLAALRSAAD